MHATQHYPNYVFVNKFTNTDATKHIDDLLEEHDADRRAAARSRAEMRKRGQDV